MVLVFSSAYTKVRQDDFVSKFNVPTLSASINIPQFSMQRFEQEVYDFGDIESGEEPHVEVDDEIIPLSLGN
jgi:hypothetical protein